MKTRGSKASEHAEINAIGANERTYYSSVANGALMCLVAGKLTTIREGTLMGPMLMAFSLTVYRPLSLSTCIPTPCALPFPACFSTKEKPRRLG